VTCTVLGRELSTVLVNNNRGLIRVNRSTSRAGAGDIAGESTRNSTVDTYVPSC
jgi:hypothetical protein